MQVCEEHWIDYSGHDPGLSKPDDCPAAAIDQQPLITCLYQ
jgi:hypothetical protein